MNIRASMLPGHPDCTRRSMARQYRKSFEQEGYSFNQLAPSIGSSAGTATHTGIGELFKAKWQGQAMNLDTAVDVALAEFRTEVEKGATWDETSPNANVAETQIRNMITAYMKGPAQTEMPLTVQIEGQDAPAIELELKANAGDGWMLTGHVDLVTSEYIIRDFKTGAVNREYFSQLGAYSLLLRSQKYITASIELTKDFIQRCKKTKPQEPCVSKSYPVRASEAAASGLIKSIKREWTLYQACKDLDEAFPANLHSMMCTPKYCLAFGTDFCSLSKLKK